MKLYLLFLLNLLLQCSYSVFSIKVSLRMLWISIVSYVVNMFMLLTEGTATIVGYNAIWDVWECKDMLFC